MFSAQMQIFCKNDRFHHLTSLIPGRKEGNSQPRTAASVAGRSRPVGSSTLNCCRPEALTKRRRGQHACGKPKIVPARAPIHFLIENGIKDLTKASFPIHAAILSP
jgi:hypothetical protein